MAACCMFSWEIRGSYLSVLPMGSKSWETLADGSPEQLMMCVIKCPFGNTTSGWDRVGKLVSY